MNVTEQHLRQYHEEGYTLVPGLIPPEAMAAARQRALQVVEGEHNWPQTHFQYIDPSRYQRRDGQPYPLGIQRPAMAEPVFAQVAKHPNLVQAMSRLLGGPVELFTDQVGVKMGFIKEEQGSRTFYHQDSYYWHIDPELGCNCWIPMDVVDRQAIALAVMPASHQGWTLQEHESYFDDPSFGRIDPWQPFKRHRIPQARVEFDREVLVPMKPGDGLFFTNYTWHRSEPNRSGQTLCFYAIAYQRAKEA